MKHGLHKGRAAFLLNMNAKSVTSEFKKKLVTIIPEEDLFFSQSMLEAKNNLQKIIDCGYAFVFSGGGDGTVVSTINMLMQLTKNMPYSAVPKIGVLRLGTGNAMARLLDAGSPEEDISDILAGKKMDSHLVSMIETKDGFLTPFAGIGYDGEILNDFTSIKTLFFQSPLRKIFSSVFGFTVAGLIKTLPRQIMRKRIYARVKSNYPAYRIINVNGRDEEIYLDKNKPLFVGNASLICVGSIPSVGYDFKMFPFAKRRPGYIHLRVSAIPLSVCLANLYPSIWKGHFRHPKLYDYLVKDVSIESDLHLPYQLAGDSMGHAGRLYFKIAHEPVPMVAIHREQKHLQKPFEPLFTPLG